jgi:hypothetical protein
MAVDGQGPLLKFHIMYLLFYLFTNRMYIFVKYSFFIKKNNTDWFYFILFGPPLPNDKRLQKSNPRLSLILGRFLKVLENSSTTSGPKKDSIKT